MFGFRKKGPDAAFVHASDCKIVKIDPDVDSKWWEETTGHWRAECVCGVQYWHEPFVERRTRLDPLDPANFRHAPQCEHRDTTDPVLIKAILRVREGGGGGYWWVACSMCECGWQVPHYAAERVG